MKRNFISAALAASALLLSAGLASANEAKAAATGEAGGKAGAKSASGSKDKTAAKGKAAQEAKPVDINGATAAELKKLPGIGDAEALKIIAGRPYGSSAWLVTKHILPEGAYISIQDMIVARQPFKDGAKNAEIYRKLAEKEAAEQKAGDKK